MNSKSFQPIESEREDGEETRIYEFAPTPIMSTYLVAFVIGAYEYVETRDRNDLRIRVYTPVGEKDRGLFALHVSPELDAHPEDCLRSDGSEDSPVLRRLLRHQISADEIGHDRHRGFRFRRDGELGLDHLSRNVLVS